MLSFGRERVGVSSPRGVAVADVGTDRAGTRRRLLSGLDEGGARVRHQPLPFAQEGHVGRIEVHLVTRAAVRHRAEFRGAGAEILDARRWRPAVVDVGERSAPALLRARFDMLDAEDDLQLRMPVVHGLVIDARQRSCVRLTSRWSRMCDHYLAREPCRSSTPTRYLNTALITGICARSADGVIITRALRPHSRPIDA